MVEVTQQVCACNDCVCIVDIENAVKMNNKNYCGDACAQGHPNGEGCGHGGCVCCG